MKRVVLQERLTGLHRIIGLSEGQPPDMLMPADPTDPPIFLVKVTPRYYMYREPMKDHLLARFNETMDPRQI